MNPTGETMKILAMDSTAPRGGAALLEGDRSLAQSRFQGPEGHVALLPAAVADLFERTGWRASMLDLIVITLGPGSFSGVRIALGVAQGMALAADTPLVGVSSLEPLAAGAGGGDEPVATILDARRGEVFAALYQRRERAAPEILWGVETGRPEPLAAAMVHFMDDSKDPARRIRCVGSGSGVYEAIFQRVLGERFLAGAESEWQLDPVVLGRLGRHRFLQRGAMPALTLEPLYQRQPDAVMKLREKTGHTDG